MQAHTTDQYVSALQGLMPEGPIWPRDPDAVQTQLLAVAGAALARVEARALALVEEADPQTTFECLVDWEGNLGLPDSCSGAAAGIIARRLQVFAKETTLGGQSPAYFVALAAALGFTITIDTFTPARINGANWRGSRIGDRLYGQAWAHVWRVNAPGVTIIPSAIGSAIGDRLRTWNNQVLECVLQRFKPAHTILLFAYGS